MLSGLPVVITNIGRSLSDKTSVPKELAQITNGVAKADAYTVTMYIMAGIPTFGFCNLAIQEVHERRHMRHDEPADFDGAFPNL